MTNGVTSSVADSDRVRLRVLTCQTDGAISQSVSDNIDRWRAHLENAGRFLRDKKLDLVHFPETSFCRYYYRDQADLESYGGAEEAGQGSVFAFASETALQLGAYVVVGYVEKAQQSQQETKTDQQPTYYNSLYVVGRDGTLLLSHRKRDLFQPDFTWSSPTDGAYSTLRLTNCEGLEVVVGLILCQEILGPQEGDRTLRAAATQFDAESVDIVVFSCCWPKGGGAHKFPPCWEEQLSPLIDAERAFLFCVADGCGSEPNCLTKEQWGDRLADFSAMDVLWKRGCSGVKTFAGRGVAGKIVTGERNGAGLLDLQDEGWEVYTAEIRRGASSSAVAVSASPAVPSSPVSGDVVDSPAESER